MTRHNKPYGMWPSPLSPRQMAGDLRLYDVQHDTESDTLVWLEGRGGHNVLVMQAPDDAPRDMTSDISVRARVGYGGGDFTVAQGQVYFAGTGGRLYRQALSGGQARPITPAFGSAAAPRVSADGRWLAYIHSDEGRDSLAIVDTAGELWPAKLASGTDFVMQPAWHPQGKWLAYIAWNHPLMPWDGTELRLIELRDEGPGLPAAASQITLVGDKNTAIFQPEFSPDGRYLAYISDASGWGQLYLYDLEAQTHVQVTEGAYEHGAPAWVQGLRRYGWSHTGSSLLFLRSERGFDSLWRYSLRSGSAMRVQHLDDYTSLSQISTSCQSDQVALIASASRIPTRVVTYAPEPMPLPEQLDSSQPGLQVMVPEVPAGVQIVRRSSTENIPPAQLAAAQAITWTGHNGETVHGLYYAPVHSDDEADDEASGPPPLIVDIHGGPTSHRTADYDLRAQFFATRGYAVLNVNYRGSTGYGKAYMARLRGHWGIYDVEDAASGAEHLAREGLTDPAKRVIIGGSAGGFTVYQSLIDKPGFYKAGICLFGVANQFDLATDTHKFEERYLDSLLGPLPDAADIYRARSPLFHAEKIRDPIAIFQGADDRVVPKAQSDSIVKVLRARGTPHEYHVYEGEGHGWRKPETIEDFYGRVLRFLQQYVLFA